MKIARLVLLASLATVPIVAPAGARDDVSAAKQTIVDYYAAWAAHDVARYRGLCTSDYLILDDGKMSNLEQDIAYLRTHPNAWRGRTDRFDFRKVIVRGDEAYVIYFLNSEIKHGQVVEHQRYLESAVLRRSVHGWQVFLLHSTKLAAIPEKHASVAANTETRAAMAWLNPPEASAGWPIAPQDNKILLHIPGSTRAYTRAQTLSMHVAPDWWPQDHPPMPRIVAHGRGKAWPCGHCHLPTGLGRPEDAATAGLPRAYIIEQIQAFRDGRRTSPIMHEEASHLSDADLKLAASYFSSLRFTPWTTVVETATIPKMHGEYSMWVPIAGAGREPLGERIIVTPVNLERAKFGDTRSGYIAYVPPGSIARGKALATTGGGRTTACMACHGADLHGVGVIPPLAGRMPNYIVHQLIKFQDGDRRGPATVPMQREVAHLTLNDMIDVAAYAASRKP